MPIELWPDTAESIHTFIAMATQWRVGMSGATGLDYAALPAVFDLRGVEPARRPDVFEDVRTMEIETLRLQAESK